MSIRTLFVFQNSIFFLVFFIASISVKAQPSTTNWYDAPKSTEEPFNISTDLVYEKLIKDKKGHPVVVAVIDSGVDIEHEDLKNIIWTNNDEIPDNGIDDDKNGYIDDVHGWNFIGGKDGGKCSLSIIASDNIVKEKDFHAGNIIREVSKHIQGGGGGQAFFAKAGGKNADGLTSAIEEVKAKL